MKLKSWVLITFSLMWGDYSFSQQSDQIRITVDFNSVSYQEAFDQIERVYPVKLYYRKKWLPDTTFSESFLQTNIEDVLKRLLANTDLTIIRYDQYSFVIVEKQALGQEFTLEYFNRQEAQRELLRSIDQSEIIILGDSSLNDYPDELDISGRILDMDSEEPLAGATIFIDQLATTTDAKGEYRLRIPQGIHQAEISYLGYNRYNANINAFTSSKWDIALIPTPKELEEVLITGTGQDDNIRSVQIGTISLNPKQIKQIPSFLGEPDVIKSLLTLPGVSTVGEGASGFNVRGGRIDQNLILQDEALVFNSSHVLGFFSIFNADLIREVTLFKGHIPPQYGGRISSVLDVKLKNNIKKFRATGGIGAVSSKLALEVPVIKEKTSVILGGRSSYSDWILQRIPEIRESSVAFYDLNAKISHRINDNSLFDLSLYQSHDEFAFSRDFGFEWDSRFLSFRWEQLILNEVLSSFSFSTGEIENSNLDRDGIDAFRLDNGLENWRIKQIFFITPGEHKSLLGFELTNYNAKPEVLNPLTDQSGVIADEVAKDKGREVAFFLNDEFNLTPGISISAGLRYSRFNQLGPDEIFNYQQGQPRSIETITDTTFFEGSGSVVSYDGFEPRFSMKVELTGISSLKFSFNRINQYIHLISNSTAALPIDIWQVSNTYIRPQRSNNFTLGYFRNFSFNEWETSLEVYYKDIDNLIEYKDFANLLLDPNLETELINATGFSYGSELSIKRTRGRITGQFSYTFSRAFSKTGNDPSQEQVNDGQRFPSNFDQPHNFNISINNTISKKSSISVNFTYSSGRPIPAPSTYYFLGSTIIPHFSERNRFRIPDYHRLDLSYTINVNAIKRSRFKSSLTFSIYNLYARDNAFSVFFRQEPNDPFGAFKLTALGSAFPSVTYNFTF